MSKLYTPEQVEQHRRQAFLAGRITEAQSLRASYASKNYNPHLYEAIKKRLAKYRKALDKIDLTGGHSNV
jgi:hypothetical protein